MRSSDSAKRSLRWSNPGVERGVVRFVAIAPEDQASPSFGVRAGDREHAVDPAAGLHAQADQIVERLGQIDRDLAPDAVAHDRDGVSEGIPELLAEQAGAAGTSRHRARSAAGSPPPFRDVRSADRSARPTAGSRPGPSIVSSYDSRRKYLKHLESPFRETGLPLLQAVECAIFFRRGSSTASK